MENGEYKQTLRDLQIELVKLQRHIIENNLQILILFEGRDAAGKDGVIKRITEHLSPRETRVIALGKPSDRDTSSWYFQRYVPYLPSKQEMVLMNRSWYNRAGVERVMGFCADEEYRRFMRTVIPFEHMLVDSGIQLVKYYLDISKDEQVRRLEERRNNPLKQWKVSPIDQVAVERWDDYSAARNEMLEQTHNDLSPWHVVRANDKKEARINIIRHLLSCNEYPEKRFELTRVDTKTVLPFVRGLNGKGILEP